MITPVKYPLAKLLKEKGFDLPVLYHYWLEDSKWILKSNEESVRDIDIFTTGGTIIINVEELLDNYDIKGNPEIFKAAPTISEVVMWLYEKHGIWIQPFILNKTFAWKAVEINNQVTWCLFSQQDKGYNSPTEAYEAAIEYVLLNLI